MCIRDSNNIYYMLTPDGKYYNFSGCGNVLNCNQPIVQQFILDCQLILETENGKLKALVVPDYEQAELEGVDKNDLPQIMQNNLTELNTLLAAYERVSELAIYPTEFEKTPKRSIKRYLYSPSLLTK